VDGKFVLLVVLVVCLQEVARRFKHYLLGEESGRSQEARSHPAAAAEQPRTETINDVPRRRQLRRSDGLVVNNVEHASRAVYPDIRPLVLVSPSFRAKVVIPNGINEGGGQTRRLVAATARSAAATAGRLGQRPSTTSMLTYVESASQYSPHADLGMT
jgi:hypothetical protein